MTNKHTPGPWSFAHEFGKYYALLREGKWFGRVRGKETAQLIAAAPELLEALIAANDFIDGIRQDLHHERVADWYPEGAHNSASAMSESMRLIGNRCADFDVASAAIKKATGETK